MGEKKHWAEPSENHKMEATTNRYMKKIFQHEIQQYVEKMVLREGSSRRFQAMFILPTRIEFSMPKLGIYRTKLMGLVFCAEMFLASKLFRDNNK